jgi:hypothetical protein
MPCALGLAAVALTAGILQAAGGRAPARIYTVTQVRSLLHQNPAAWAGSALWVRGWIAGCPGILTPAIQQVCQGWDRYLLSDAASPVTKPLPVARGDPSALLALLRRLPLPGRLLPTPQALRWGTDAASRVLLRPAPMARCYDVPPCFLAVVLDAAPDSLGDG